MSISPCPALTRAGIIAHMQSPLAITCCYWCCCPVYVGAATTRNLYIYNVSVLYLVCPSDLFVRNFFSGSRFHHTFHKVVEAHCLRDKGSNSYIGFDWVRARVGQVPSFQARASRRSLITCVPAQFPKNIYIYV